MWYSPTPKGDPLFCCQRFNFIKATSRTIDCSPDGPVPMMFIEECVHNFKNRTKVLEIVRQSLNGPCDECRMVAVNEALELAFFNLAANRKRISRKPNKRASLPS